MKNIVLMASESMFRRVFSSDVVRSLEELGDFHLALFRRDWREVSAKLTGAQIIVSTWGMPVLDEDFLDMVPRLEAVFYAAGSVKGFVTDAMFERGVVVSSAAPANAVPVAEYAVAVILLSNKRFWQQMNKQRQLQTAAKLRGNYKAVVGIIGAGEIGRRVLQLLKGHDLELLVYDPYISNQDAVSLGAEKVELDELMRRSDVISLHAPNIPETRHMINASNLRLVKDGATFINTSRGALVDEDALITELHTGRITAVLDVTDPEPPADYSPFLDLPNVIYTPHIAGSMWGECERMAAFAVDELRRYISGEELLNPISREMLATMA